MTGTSNPFRLLLLLAAALLAIPTGCSKATESPPSTDDGNARGSGSAPGALPEPPVSSPDTNTIRWTTASEAGNYGFDVYRGDTPDGPFRRLTGQPIAGAGTTDEPSRYEYVDATIEPGREYFYYVESISSAGERQRFTPVRRAPPKPRSTPAGAGGSAAEGEPEQ